MSNPVAIDFETYYSTKKKYGLRTLIAESYCKHELFDPYIVAAYDGEQSWVGHPRDFNWEALHGRDLLAHNSYFDSTVLKELIARKVIPNIVPKSFTCTANMTSYLCNRRSLDAAMLHLLGVKVDKTARADADNKHWPKDFSEAEQQTMLKYALNDPRHCWDLFQKFGPQWPTTERELSRITIEQGQRGVQVDVDLLNNYICWAHEALQKTEEIIPWLENDSEDWDEFDVSPTSTKCIAEQCRRVGIPCAPVKREDEEAYYEWEDLYSPAHRWIKALTAWRSVNKLYRTLLVCKSRLRDDNTMPFALLYFGAHTGRWSGTARVNFQNMRKVPVFIGQDGLMEQDDKKAQAATEYFDEYKAWPSWVRHAIDFRALVVPRPGMKMISSDLSQIEPRVLAWLTGNTALLDQLRTGMSLYEGHARRTMGWAGGDLKKQDKGKYALAKARVLGLGYGAGWEKFITMAQTLAGLDITEGDPETEEIELPNGLTKTISGYGKRSREIVTQFRADNPDIVGLWKSLDSSMKSSIKQDFVVELPSGRKLKYEYVRCERRTVPDPETGKPVSREVFTVGIGGRRFVTYGGKLTENLVQAASRDVFGEMIVKMDQAGLTNLFSCHDEAVLEVKPDVKAADVREIMSRTPDWMPGLALDAEAKVCDRYCK